MYISFSKEWFDKNKKHFEEKWKEDMGEENPGYMIDLEGEVEHEISNERFSITEHNDVYVFLEIEMTPQILSEMANELAKTMNKLKTALEALK